MPSCFVADCPNLGVHKYAAGVFITVTFCDEHWLERDEILNPKDGGSTC
jgi:hypothetical protein